MKGEQIPLWVKMMFLCVGGALLLGILNGGVSYAARHRERASLESILNTKDYSLGPEHFVFSHRFVKSYAIIRNPQGKGTPEMYLLHLAPARYGITYCVLAAYANDGKLLGYRVMDEAIPTGSVYAKPPSSLRALLLERGKMEPGGPKGTSTLSPKEVETVSGSTLTFLLVLEAIQEGAVFVKQLGRKG